MPSFTVTDSKQNFKHLTIENNKVLFDKNVVTK